MMNNIIKLRQALHRYPEISNQEFRTSERITDFVSSYQPDEIINLSKTGKAFVWKGQENGITLMFRAELDALPIQEENEVQYISQNKGAAHLCGHDGHMAILAGLAERIAADRPNKGRVVLLFQPAEEVEQGARDVVNDPGFVQIEPDMIFALHNIPGIKKHQVVIRDGTFASASKGLTVRLYGKTSHAGEPENGINPANAISRIIHDINILVKQKNNFKDLSFSTFIHIKLGEISFGTSPGYAEIRMTLRSFENSDMETMSHKIETIIKDICLEEKISHEFEYSEVFPATVNNSECVEIIKESAESNELEWIRLDKPFRWSEDFAYYTDKYKGGFFGLGSGTGQAQLHNPDYDFPDDIIETGIRMFYGIYKAVLYKDQNERKD